MIVRIAEKPHRHFKRVNKDDLVYVERLTLVQALNSVPVTLVTLDGRKLSIAMDEIISPQTVKVVKSEGMPIFDKNDLVSNILYKEKKGSLYIKFHIDFPKFIDPEKKEEITRLLEN